MAPTAITLSEARRIALAAQGFDRPRPAGPIDARHIRRTIRQIGLLQIDYVNVLVPAHYLVLYSRLGPYERTRLNDLIYRKREFTEHWAHEASIVPVETWPLLRHRMELHRSHLKGFEAVIDGQPDYIDWILEEVRTRGPLTADDIPEREGVARRQPTTWYRTVPRAVLEAHFGRGTLAVSDRRPNFARAFDLAERVIASEHHGRLIDKEDAQRELIRISARSHGIGTVSDLADYFRMPIRDTRQRIHELSHAGELQEVHVQGWSEAAYLHPASRLPKRIEASTLLSPFDPVVWYRPRASRLFHFDYRIEIYTPEAKRKWGYYVLPFLLGERIVARIDLKADRAARRLQVLAAHLEPDEDARAVAEALSKELRTMAIWLNLDAVSVRRKGDFARVLAAIVRIG